MHGSGGRSAGAATRIGAGAGVVQGSGGRTSGAVQPCLGGALGGIGNARCLGQSAVRRVLRRACNAVDDRAGRTIAARGACHTNARRACACRSATRGRTHPACADTAHGAKRSGAGCATAQSAQSAQSAGIGCRWHHDCAGEQRSLRQFLNSAGHIEFLPRFDPNYPPSLHLMRQRHGHDGKKRVIGWDKVETRMGLTSSQCRSPRNLPFMLRQTQKFGLQPSAPKRLPQAIP